MTRWLGVKLLAALALGIPMLTVPSSAQATSIGCTWAPGTYASYVCLGIYGSGRYVSSFRVSRNKQYSSICNYKAKVVVQAPDGRAWRFFSPYHSGCSWNTAWMDMAAYRYFPNNSVACGHWFEMGRWIPGVPCNRIFR